MGYLFIYFFHSFLIKIKSWRKLQHHFYLHLSTEMSLVRITHDFKVAESKNHLRVLGSPDLSAAFDPADHPFLLKLFLTLASSKSCSPNVLPATCSHLRLYSLPYVLMLNDVALVLNSSFSLSNTLSLADLI